MSASNENLYDPESSPRYGTLSFSDYDGGKASASSKSSLRAWWTYLPKRNKILMLAAIVLVCAVVLTVTLVVTIPSDSSQHSCKLTDLPEVRDNPKAPLPERVKIEILPLPPTAPSNSNGSCSPSINPRGTGCIDSSDSAIQSGDFLPDGNHIVATMTFSGAPPSPNPASIYSGPHVVVLKADGTTFSNGDSWKCITCGVPPANAKSWDAGELSYPQVFRDGKRILAGTNVIDCSPYLLVDDRCTPNVTFAYPIHWATSADGSGKGGSIRELRLHPDNIHLGFNCIVLTPLSTDQYGYIGRFSFNPSPTTGIPLVPRYEITNVTLLYDASPAQQPFAPNPDDPAELLFKPLARSVGEFRGWSKDGQEALWIGQPCESGNFDIMATKLSTGETRRLTRNPEYTDPVDMSPDNNWIVVMDTRGSDRLMFAAGMRGIPSLSDLVTSTTVASIRNNGDRRFFKPYLIDRYGDRGAYQGQLLTAEGDGAPGSINDPNWNGRADPRWSPNGTLVAFWQALVTAPACGGVNPLPCPKSTEPGGRRSRVLIARLLDREATPAYPIPPVPKTIPWGTPYVPGKPLPIRYHVPGGTYTLRGKVSGSALVHVNETSDRAFISSISVHYTHYSDDGYHIIDGYEQASRNRTTPFLVQIFWKSNLTLSGCLSGKKLTSDNGYSVTLDMWNPVVQSTGSLSTTIENMTYTSPNPGT